MEQNTTESSPKVRHKNDDLSKPLISRQGRKSRVLISTKGMKIVQCEKAKSSQQETTQNITSLKGILGYDIPTRISLVKQMDSTLYALVNWDKRKSGYIPTPAFYPVLLLRRYPSIANMLLSYYESIIT